MIGARESKFFHHLSIILTCKNSLFTCKNYCKMMKDAHKNGEAPLTSSGASPYALVCRSACVLQAGSDAGDGAQDEVDESGLLALRELFLVHLLAQRLERQHLSDGQRVHVRGADADGLAEHVTVLQRPLVTHDALKLVRSMALENHGECGCAGSLLDKVT